MPFINTKVNISVSEKQETEIKTALGKAISLIRGKSENWLMLNFEDNCRLYFRGDKTMPSAFIEVKIYGSASAKEYDDLTTKITEIISSVLNIQSSQIYVKYEEVEYWGYSGHNF